MPKPATNKAAANKPAQNKPAQNKPAQNKPAEDKPVENKKAENKPTPKAVQPKKQVANNATKKENKPAENAPKQQNQNQKRKREENGASPAHDVDKKLKPSTEAGVIPAHFGKRMVLYNLPEDVTFDELKDLFANIPKVPNVRFLTNMNKERVGHASLHFTDEESFKQASALTDLKVRGHEISVRSDMTMDSNLSVFVPRFPRTIDENSVKQFFEGLEINFILFQHTNARVTGTCVVEFADEASKNAALAKSNTEFEGKNILVVPYEADRPKKPKTENTNAQKTQKAPKAPKAPKAAKEQMEVTEEKSDDKPNKEAAKQNQKPAVQKPAQKKPAPAKNAKQTKTTAKKPNQTKQAPAKKEAAPKPGAKTAAKPQKAAAKAQKKN